MSLQKATKEGEHQVIKQQFSLQDSAQAAGRGIASIAHHDLGINYCNFVFNWGHIFYLAFYRN